MNQPTKEFYDKLSEAVEYFNKELFDGMLPNFIITVQRNQKSTSYFDPDRWANNNGAKAHELAINPSHLATSTLLELFQHIVHDLVHCWQHIEGTASRAGYHNQKWAAKMVEIGLQPTETGLPGGKVVGQIMHHYPIINGPFLQACTKLISAKEQGGLGWNLPWLDRECKEFNHSQLNECLLTQAKQNKEAAALVSHTLKLDPTVEITQDDPESYEEDTPQEHTASATNQIIDTPHDSTDPYDAIAESLPNVDREIISALLASRASDHMPAEADMVIKQPTVKDDTKKKTRYKCKCNYTIYGKPSLNIKCLDCNTKFVATAKSTPEPNSTKKKPVITSDDAFELDSIDEHDIAPEQQAYDELAAEDVTYMASDSDEDSTVSLEA